MALRTNRSQKRTDRTYLQMLVDVAHADGFEPKEIETIEMLARRRGISDREIQRARRNAGRDSTELAVPASNADRIKDMIDLVTVMVADGQISPAERDTARGMASRYGLAPKIIDEILIAALDGATRDVAVETKRERVKALQQRRQPSGTKRDAEESFLQMLIAMASVDGLEKTEISMMGNIAQRRGIPVQRFREAMLGIDKGRAKLHVPSDPRERFETLFDLVCVLLSDGCVSRQELDMARSVAKAFDLPLDAVDNMIMEVLNHFKTADDAVRAPDANELDAFLNAGR